MRAYYYTVLAEDQKYSPIRPLVDWLDYNGYAVVTKPTREYTDSSGRREVKGDMDIELAADVMEMSQRFDHIVLFSGDGDFFSLIDAVQRKGVRASVVSTVCSKPLMASNELQRQADNFVELYDLVDYIARDQPQKPMGDADHNFGKERPESSPYHDSTEEKPNGDYNYMDYEDEGDFPEIGEHVGSPHGDPR